MTFKWFYSIIIVECLCSNHCKRKVDEPVQTISTSLSFTKNPADYWQVGYSLTNTLDPLQFQLCTFADTSNPIALWHPAVGSNAYYPYTGQNRNSVSQLDVSSQWALKAGQIAMEGSNSGQYSMLRFVSPVSGKLRLKVVFEGVHFGLSTTDVHILLNSVHVFDDNIDGYGGDPSFHSITGSHPSTTYEADLQLQKNDILTFAVGYGTNKNHFNDTTGLMIILEFV
ncbi:MAG TPA: hypothetical protein VGQ09_09840 [Chitinophagaceae bacterium]|jgi:hypothetical protein|nr:hypothetical protein [Chitinophagaceae bacterium]